MRIIATVSVFIICAFLLGCTKGSEINGRSIKTANRSVSMIKDRLPTEQRIEFEVSYWTLRDSIKDREKFLDTVDGKSSEELVVLGKEVFQQRKNSGFVAYDQYDNWEQMIAKFTQERIEQNSRKKPDPRDNANNVLYNL